MTLIFSGGFLLLDSSLFYVEKKTWRNVVSGTIWDEERCRTSGSFHIKSTSYVMENFKRVHDSIKPPVWSPASSPNLSLSSLARWAAVSGFARAQPSTVRARYARPHSPPAKLDPDEFGNSARTEPAGLIES